MRTVKPNGSKLADLRMSAGLTQEDLAEMANVTVRTVQRVEAGHPAYAKTLQLVATALGCRVGDIIASEEPLGPMAEAEVVLTLPGDPATWPQGKKDALFEAIQRIVKGGIDVRVIGIGRGSVELTLRMTNEQAERLMEAFAEGRLIEYRVTSVDAYPVTAPSFRSVLVSNGRGHNLYHGWIHSREPMYLSEHRLYSRPQEDTPDQRPPSQYDFVNASSGSILAGGVGGQGFDSVLRSRVVLTLPPAGTRASVADAWDVDSHTMLSTVHIEAIFPDCSQTFLGSYGTIQCHMHLLAIEPTYPGLAFESAFCMLSSDVIIAVANDP